MCQHTGPLCNLEAEALLEHDFSCKKCAGPSRERLSGGEVPEKVSAMWCEDSAGLWMENGAPLPQWG